MSNHSLRMMTYNVVVNEKCGSETNDCELFGFVEFVARCLEFSVQLISSNQKAEGENDLERDDCPVKTVMKY